MADIVVALKNGRKITLPNVTGPPTYVDVPLTRLAATITVTSATIDVPWTSGIFVGMPCGGAGIAPESFVISLIANTSVTLNNPASGSGTNVVLGFGDGYYDGSVYRNQFSLADIGGEALTMQIIWGDDRVGASALLGSSSTGAVPVPPRHLRKKRTLKVWPTSDAVGFYSIWADRLDGEGRDARY